MQGLGVSIPLANVRIASLPPAPLGHVARPELIARLRGSRQRLCLLCAPAGFGKSVLLVDSLARGEVRGRVIWLNLGGRVESLSELCSRIADALGLTPALGTAPATLLRFFSGSQTALKLVLDDFPEEVPIELNNWFDHLLALPSSHLQLLVSCRQRPRWNLPRLMLRDDLLELDAHQLAMTRDEFEALLETHSPLLDERRRDALWMRCEGWWAGVRLLLPGASEAHAGRDLQRVREYLDHELLARLGETERAMLHGLAHLPRFSTELCAQLWEEQGGAQSFRRLLQCQAFIFPLQAGGAWYQLLPVVAEALQDCVSPRELSRLRLQSCRLLSIAGHLNEAIEQALRAEQPEVAANYMQRLQPSWQLAEHNLHRLLNWRAQLPRHLLQGTPRLVYLCALALLSSGRLAEADGCLTQMARFLPHPKVSIDKRLRANWQALHGFSLASQGVAAEAERHCREALEHLPSGDWISIVICYCTLARVAMVAGRLDEAREWLDEAVELSRRVGCLDSEALINSDRLRLLILQDELPAAEALLADTLRWRTAAQIQHDPLLARLLFLQGELHLLRGRDGAAEDSLRAGLLQAQQSSAPYIQFGHLLLAEVASRRGDEEQLLLHLHEAERRMHCGRIDSVCYSAPMLLQNLQVLATRGEWRALLQRAASLEVGLAPLLQPSLPQEVELLRARAQAGLGQHEEARQRLQALIGDCAARGYCRLEREARQVLASLPEAEQGSALAEDSVAARLEDLTPRESAVLGLLARGMSNQEIADSLFLSVNTVKYHAKNINAKLGSTRRTQAIVFAKAMGILQ